MLIEASQRTNRKLREVADERSWSLPGARPRLTSQIEQVVALGFVEPQRVGQGVEHRVGRTGQLTSLHADVVVDRHARQHGHLFAASPSLGDFPRKKAAPLARELSVLYEKSELRELGIVPYSPLGRGFLTGAIRSVDDFDDFDEIDGRRNNPRFMGENFDRNLALADEVKVIADEADATPAQVALAWLLSKGDYIAPIPGTKRVSRIEREMSPPTLSS